MGQKTKKLLKRYAAQLAQQHGLPSARTQARGAWRNWSDGTIPAKEKGRAAAKMRQALGDADPERAR